MKTTDRLLILAVAFVLVLMLLLVFDPRMDGSGAPKTPSLTGEPREVDVDLLRRRLLRGELTDHEALYYR